MVVWFAFLLLPITLSYGETIYFKDGTKIKGKIVEDGGYYMVIEQNNRPRRYFSDLIERVEEDIVDASISENIQTDNFLFTQETKIEWILRLLQINGTRDTIKDNIAQIIESAPLGREEEIRDIFDLDGLMEEIIPIYDEHFTETEIQEIVAFYETPIGQKLLEESPDVNKKVLETTIKYFGNRSKK